MERRQQTFDDLIEQYHNYLLSINRCADNIRHYRYEWERIKRFMSLHQIEFVDGIQLLLQQPDQSTQKGRRDLAMLSLMYDCAARVQEIIDLTPAMIRLTKPYTVKIIGKGNKPRIVPLMEQQVFHLKRYLAENRLLENRNNFHPLFFNSRNEKLTRQGVANILQTYASIARGIRIQH